MKLLDAGANDYVTKPFSVQELVARIRVLLRQHQHSTVDTVIFDDGVLKSIFPNGRFLNQQLLSLTRKEYQLLNLLAKNKGQLITQPQILKELWANAPRRYALFTDSGG